MEKRIISLSLILGTLLVTTTVTSTLAWYQARNVVYINDIDITLRAKEDLFIATKDQEDAYKQFIDYSELKKIGDFKPVSSMFSSKWISQKETTPTFYDIYNDGGNLVEENGVFYGEPTEEIATEGFYSQEFFLKSKSRYYAVLDPNELRTFIVPNEEKNAIVAQKMHDKNPSLGTVEEIIEKLNNLVNSIRFSILVDYKDHYDYKIFDICKNGITKLGGIMDTDTNGFYDYATNYAPNTRYETVFGEVNDRSLLKYNYNSTATDPVDNPSWFHAAHADDVYMVDMEKSIENGFEIAEEVSTTLAEYDELKQKVEKGISTKEEREDFLYIPVDANEATRIVISIYLEGWDLDNVNETMEASFDCQFTFGVIDRNIF